jgi:chemotaxis protein CheX
MVAVKSLAPTVPASRLASPFAAAVREVMRAMVKVETTIDRPHLKRAPSNSCDVSCIIGFSGRILGTLVLGFEQDTALRIVSAFSGSTIAYESPDFAESIGDLSVMIALAARKELGPDVNITAPSVILGSGHTVARLSQLPCLILPCKTPIGRFHLEVCLKGVAI